MAAASQIICIFSITFFFHLFYETFCESIGIFYFSNENSPKEHLFRLPLSFSLMIINCEVKYELNNLFNFIMLRRNISNFPVGHADLYRETSLDPNLNVSIVMPWLLEKPASTQKMKEERKKFLKITIYTVRA